MVELNKGTIEPIAIDVTDALGNLTTLDDANAQFDIEDFFNVSVQEGLTANNVGMTALCQIDTTSDDYPEGIYKLFLYFSAVPDSPRLGPVMFKVREALTV